MRAMQPQWVGGDKQEGGVRRAAALWVRQMVATQSGAAAPHAVWLLLP
jgi:hypothetical protein